MCCPPFTNPLVMTFRLGRAFWRSSGAMIVSGSGRLHYIAYTLVQLTSGYFQQDIPPPLWTPRNTFISISDV